MICENLSQPTAYGYPIANKTHTVTERLLFYRFLNYLPCDLADNLGRSSPIHGQLESFPFQPGMRICLFNRRHE
jgi:hypothetical protein